MSTRDRPNILLFFTDQQRGDTIGALGNPVIKTPALDSLCRGGIAFTSAYSPSPVCISARCSMIYGQYPLHTGCYENTPMPTDGRQSFMGALTAAGYRTHGIGKCHFSPDAQALRGFETRERQEEMVRHPEMDDYLAFLHGRGYDYVCDPHGVRGEMYYIPQPSQLPACLHPTQWVGDRSEAFVRERADSSQPWFLFSSYVHPHPPFAPPNPWHKLYRAALMPLPHVPPRSDALRTYVNRHQNRYKYRDQGLDTNLLRCLKAYYYASISFVDYQIGRVLAALDETGQLENTLIIHTADHGEHLGDYECFGKRTMQNSASRIPLIASWPGRFDGGRVCDRPVSLVDIAPTVCAASGAAMESHDLDGVDLADIVAGTHERHMVFSQHALKPHKTADERAAMSTYMAVSRDWKYVYSAPDNQEYLFDRRGDPLETRNRAGVVFCGPALRSMRSSLMEHLRAGGETAGIADGGTWRAFDTRDVPSDPDMGLLAQDHPWADTAIEGYTDDRGLT